MEDSAPDGEASDPEAVFAAVAEADFPAPASVAAASASEVADGQDCPARRMSDVRLWLPLSPTFLANRNCFFSMMRLVYDPRSKRFSNNTGVNVWAYEGGDDGTEYRVFRRGNYHQLMNFISSELGYTLGRNLFALPYDFRQDLTGMEHSSGELQRLADKIEAAVDENCGKKAIMIGHSMGGLVSLALLRSPRLDAWRQRNIRGYLALATPFGGAMTAVNGRISGRGAGLSGNETSERPEGRSGLVTSLAYKATFGMPSVVMMLPYAQALGRDWTVAVTPSATYTVADLKQLLQDIGDTTAVEFFRQVRTLGALTQAGPIPGISTHCIYGAQVDTAKTYKYDTDIIPYQQGPEPTALVIGKGDGTVNLESLRLCSRLTNRRRITELGGEINHNGVLTDTYAQYAVVNALRSILSE
eukprot:gene12030-12175_t